MSHLNNEDLIACVEGRLTDQAKHLVKEHIQDCGACAEEFRQWTGLFEIIRNTRLQNPPEQSIRNCIALFSSKPVRKLRHVVAQLVFDSFSQPLTEGIRGAPDAQQILLQGDDLDLHLRISYAPRAIVGQLLQRSERRFVSGAEMRILRNGEPLETSVTDSLGEFRFKQAPMGDLQVQADLPSDVRLVGEFTVRGE